MQRKEMKKKRQEIKKNWHEMKQYETVQKKMEGFTT